MILNNEYLNLVEIARNKCLSISLAQYNEIRKLYKDVADELKMRANKAKNRSLSQGWLKDYKKVINIKLGEMDKVLQSQIKSSIEKSAEASNVIQLNFFDLLNLKYGLNMKQTFRTMFSNIPSNVTAELVSGSFYKDGLGLSHRIWFNHNKVNGNIDYLIQKGIAEKKSAYDLALDVAKYVNPEFKADWEWNKVYPKSNKKIDYCAQRLARTSISHSYTLSMLRGCEVNPFITKVRWHSVFAEGRTCELCEARDGRVFFLKDCPMDHPNGMCYQEPILDDSLEDIGSRLRDWVDGNTDTELDNWYDKYANNSSSKKNQNMYIPKDKNSSIIKEKVVRSAKYKVNKNFINSAEYENKFMSFENEKINRSVLKETRNAIKKNDKKNTESMAIINEKGKAISKQDTGPFGGTVDLESIKDLANNSVVLTHNHPQSTSFSDYDIALLLDNPQVSTIVAGGHNGTVYKLSIGDGTRLDKNALNENKVIQEYCRLYSEIGDPNLVVDMLAKKYNWKYEVE